jgi:hypothetical protein
MKLGLLQTMWRYTKNLTKTKAGNLIGDGWSVGIVEHIMSYLPQA